MMRPSPVTSWNQEAKIPSVDPGGFVDETAVLIGDVIVKDKAIVCPLAVLRADEGSPIEIGEGSNVQDGVIMHCLMHSSIRVGKDCCLAHGAIVHGPCEVGDGTFVGFRATLLKTRVGAGCFISHHALVLGVDLPEGRFVPPGAVVSTQEEADRLEAVTAANREFVHEVLAVNAELVRGYLNQSR